MPDMQEEEDGVRQRPGELKDRGGVSGPDRGGLVGLSVKTLASLREGDGTRGEGFRMDLREADQKEPKAGTGNPARRRL